MPAVDGLVVQVTSKPGRKQLEKEERKKLKWRKWAFGGGVETPTGRGFRKFLEEVFSAVT